MEVSHSSLELLQYLETIYPDTMELEASKVGTPEYWKRAGVVELLKTIRYSIENGADKSPIRK